MKVFLLTSVLILASSCTTTRELPSPLTALQVEALATEVLKHTPDHTHFNPSTRFEWVFYSPGEATDFPEVSEAVIAKLKSRYMVYTTRQDFPPDLEFNDGMGRSYRRGFLFTVQIRKVSTSEIQVEYSDYEGTLAAGFQTITYRWNGRRWKVVSAGELAVS